MRITDGQIHIWSSGTPMNMHRQVSAYSAAEALRDMDEAGVDSAIIHPPSWDPKCSEVAAAAVKAHPHRFAILDAFDVTAADGRETVRTWRQRPGMCGLRFAFLRPGTTTWLTDGSMEWLWPEAAKHDVPIAMLVPSRAHEVGEIARRFPDLKLIIDHCAARRGKVDAEAFEDLDTFLDVARKHPNVAIKATGAPSYSSGPYPFKSVHDPLHRMFDAFGPERMFWGTDITRMPCSWRQCVTLFTEELPWLKGRDLELVMGEAMRRFIGWTG